MTNRHYNIITFHFNPAMLQPHKPCFLETLRFYSEVLVDNCPYCSIGHVFTVDIPLGP